MSSVREIKIWAFEHFIFKISEQFATSPPIARHYTLLDIIVIDQLTNTATKLICKKNPAQA